MPAKGLPLINKAKGQAKNLGLLHKLGCFLKGGGGTINVLAEVVQLREGHILGWICPPQNHRGRGISVTQLYQLQITEQRYSEKFGN